MISGNVKDGLPECCGSPSQTVCVLADIASQYHQVDVQYWWSPCLGFEVKVGVKREFHFATFNF